MSFGIDRSGAEGGAIAPTGAGLPVFSRRELGDGKAIVVHFTVANADLRTIEEINRAVSAALAPLRLSGGQQIIPIITGEDVQMRVADAGLLAAQIIPTIKKILNLP